MEHRKRGSELMSISQRYDQNRIGSEIIHKEITRTYQSAI